MQLCSDVHSRLVLIEEPTMAIGIMNSLHRFTLYSIHVIPCYTTLSTQKEPYLLGENNCTVTLAHSSTKVMKKK